MLQRFVSWYLENTRVILGMLAAVVFSFSFQVFPTWTGAHPFTPGFAAIFSLLLITFAVYPAMFGDFQGAWFILLSGTFLFLGSVSIWFFGMTVTRAVALVGIAILATSTLESALRARSTKPKRL